MPREQRHHRSSRQNARRRRATPQRQRLNSRARHLRRGRGPQRLADYQRGARSQLQRFRQGSILAIAITALILLLWGIPGETVEEPAAPDAPSAPAAPAEPEPIPPPVESLEQAAQTVRDLVLGFFSMLPKLLIALVLLGIAIVAAQLVRTVLHRIFPDWDRTEAMSALARICIFLLAIAAALSVLAGDVRALIGSIGLIGLALSWALQTPIESFTGWLMNSFRGYYRVGDRIEVGEVFGDVYKIDVLTTTVWEAGGPGKAVAGAQATGAMITFPNWEVLRSNIINYSRDFPYVWDEVTMTVANESDLTHTIQVFERTALRVVGSQTAEAARHYRQLIERAKLTLEVAEEPKVFLSLGESWTNCTVRYLVDARSRRRVASDLLLALTQESSRPEHRGRIIPAYPRTEVRLEQTDKFQNPNP
jgi:small conductance mechanosensitive channel